MSKRRFIMVYGVGFFAVWSGVCEVLFDAPAGSPRHVVVAYLIRGMVVGAVTGYIFARLLWRHTRA